MIEQIKERISCIEYLAQQGIHVNEGKRCVSPLRPGAKNPTSFYCAQDYWYDFGSGNGGDVVNLCAELQFNGDLSQAVHYLSRELGLKSDFTPTWRAEIQNLCNRTAAYHKALTPDDYRYLAERGLSNEDAERLMIGRVTDGYLKGRLFLPYFKNGAAVYYATRALPGGSFPDNKYMKASLEESPAYLNIPWGAQTLNRKSDILIISEGYFDAVSWEREGYPVLSPITGNFSKKQWSEVIAACRMFKKVLIIFDNDTVTHAGEGFTQRTAKRLLQSRINFLVSHTPAGIKDVNDYYTGGGSLKSLIDTAEDGMSYMAAQCKSSAELRSFILSFNRFADMTAISAALFQPILKERFSENVLKSILKAAEAPPTESMIVDELIEKHNILYVSKVGFYEWDGKIWQFRDDDTIRKYADVLYGKRFATSQRVNAVCNLLKYRSLRDIYFDRKPVLTFQNGTLEIETGKFRDFVQGDYCSIILDYDYNPEATCPNWEHFINDVTNDDPIREENLQFIGGYVLCPDCRYQKVFLLVGNGGNGKSVYLEMLQRIFGSANVSHVEPSGFPQDFQRIRLKDSLVNIGADINGNFSNNEIREWLLKVADGTAIQACYKGKDYIDFAPRCKLIFACNSIPTAETTSGLSRRMQFIEFPCQYVEYPDPDNPLQKPRDVALLGKLSSELPGIFNWFYDGYKLLTKVNYFTDTSEQSTLLEQFELQSNPIMEFCEDEDFKGTVSRDIIYHSYVEWCESTGHRPLSRSRFVPKFREAMGNKIYGERQIRVGGVPTRVFDFEPVTTAWYTNKPLSQM